MTDERDGVVLFRYRRGEGEWIAFVVMALMVGVSGVSVILEPALWKIAALPVVALALGGWVVFEFSRRHRGLSEWTIFENGVAATVDGVTTFVPHTPSTHYWLSLDGLEFVEPRLNLSMKLRDSEIAIVAHDSAAQSTYWQLKSGISRTLLPQMTAAWEQGEEIDFGGMRVSSTSLVVGESTLAWSTVSSARMKKLTVEFHLVDSPGVVRVPCEEISLLQVCLGFISKQIPVSGVAAKDIWHGT